MISRLKDSLLLIGDANSDRKRLRSIFQDSYHLLEAETVQQARMLLEQNGSCIAAVLADLPDIEKRAIRVLSASCRPGSPDAIRDHMNAVLDKVGAFKSIETSLATGQTLKDSGEAYATAVFYCKHEKNQAMYRIAFSTDMELIGLQVTKQ